ncbi:MAG: dual specificity protein phosphatase family protein [Anaerolineales bacterium]
MEIFQIDDKGLLYIGPDIDEWDNLNNHDIHVIFDLDDDLDIGIPEIPNQLLYIYFPFEDRELPNLTKLHENAKLGASLIKQGYRVLCHCGMGHNRSALLAGLILTYLGMSGGDAIELIRRQRQGALYNKNFAAYLQEQPNQDMAEMKLENQVISGI